jgi:hypothetical protein
MAIPPREPRTALPENVATGPRSDRSGDTQEKSLNITPIPLYCPAGTGARHGPCSNIRAYQGALFTIIGSYSARQNRCVSGGRLASNLQKAESIPGDPAVTVDQ